MTSRRIDIADEYQRPTTLVRMVEKDVNSTWFTSLILIELWLPITADNIKSVLQQVEQIYFGYGHFHGFWTKPADDPKR